MGRVFVLQVRSWTKRDSPGHIEVSVGGHVKAGHSALETARIEMKQELGVSASDLDGEGLRHVASYESFNEKPSLRFYNSEWREVYVGELTLAQLARLRFEQAEVAGLLMCPEREVRSLLHQQRIPLTSSLKLSMPLCLREDS